jgi:hypothetical protein
VSPLFNASLPFKVINGYFELLKRRLGSDVHFFNTFFFPLLASKGYERVRRWSRQVRDNKSGDVLQRGRKEEGGGREGGEWREE